MLAPMVSNDRAVLRGEQYAGPAHLGARIALHERFSTGSVPWTEWLYALLPEAANLTVLDIGCGSGAMWRAWADRVPLGWKVVLADLSAGMVGAALDVGPSGAVGVVADAASLPFADETYDLVLANHMLYHLPDIATGVRELHRVLRPGGALIAATNGAGHMAELGPIESSALPHLAAQLVVRDLSFSLENGAAHLETWFDDVVLHRYDDGLVVTEAAPLVSYIASMQPSLIGASERAALHHVVVRRLLDGPIRIAKDAGAFAARR